MTNYNERLDKILGIFSGGITAKGSDRGGYQTYFTEPYPIWCEARKKHAKQAITSLMKELVAEAKPINKQGEIDIDEPAYNDGYYSGAYNTLEKFERNILKELEEK